MLAWRDLPCRLILHSTGDERLHHRAWKSFGDACKGEAPREKGGVGVGDKGVCSALCSAKFQSAGGISQKMHLEVEFRLGFVAVFLLLFLPTKVGTEPPQREAVYLIILEIEAIHCGEGYCSTPCLLYVPWEQLVAYG